MSAYERLRNLFINRPSVDYLFAVLVGIAYLVGRAWIGDSFPAVDAARRAIMLQTLSGVALAVVGVSATAVAIVASWAPTERLQGLMKVVSAPLGRLILTSLVLVGAIAVAFALLIAADSGGRVWPWAIASGLLALLAARAVRLAWVLVRLLLLAANPSPAPVSLPEMPDSLKVELDPSQYGLGAVQRGREP